MRELLRNSAALSTRSEWKIMNEKSIRETVAIFPVIRISLQRALNRDPVSNSFRRRLSSPLRPVEGFIWEDRRFLSPHQQPYAGIARIPLVPRAPPPPAAHAAVANVQSYNVILICQSGRSRSSNANTVSSAWCVAFWKLDKRKTTDAGTSWDTPNEMYFAISRPAPVTRDSWSIWTRGEIRATKQVMKSVMCN